MRTDLDAIAHRLTVLSRLPQDWDSYGANPPDPRIRDVVLWCAAIFGWKGQPIVTPLPSGGISLEWPDLDLDIRPDGRIEASSFGVEFAVGPIVTKETA